MSESTLDSKGYVETAELVFWFCKTEVEASISDNVYI